jgi:hypothetical protein
LLGALVLGGFFMLRRVQRVSMEKYVPADVLAFVQIDSLGDLVDGLTHTKAWRELAPVLGISSQLRQVGSVADLIGRSGFGPDEAVVGGRAQFAIVITGIESQTGETEEGPFIHLKPLFCVIIETHTRPETASRLVRDRASIIAERIYGETIAEHSDSYQGSAMRVFEGPGSGHQLIVSSTGSAILLANQREAATVCLDAIAGRATSLEQDQILRERRKEVGGDPAVFAYVTSSGIERLFEIWPLLLASTRAEPETVSSFSDLIEHMAKQSGAVLFYSLRFDGDGVTERYLTVLRPEVAEALIEPLKPAPPAGFQSLALVPRDTEGLTLLSVADVGELPEKLLKHLSPTVDVVAGMALREFVINLKKQYGLEPKNSLGGALGNEIVLVDFGDQQPRAMLIKVNNKNRLTPHVNAYLTRVGDSVKNEQYEGTEILVASADERRALAFIGDYLVLGTRDQLIKMIDTSAKHQGENGDQRLQELLSTRPPDASIVSYRPRAEDAGKLLLAISQLTRATDGSPDLLNEEPARKAVDRLPRSISFTEFRDYGVYVETRSAVGNLRAITGLIATDEE